jgi:diguanylate cyclase (GGDEF)-like protein/PAS domain S-box-containing protein
MFSFKSDKLTAKLTKLSLSVAFILGLLVGTIQVGLDYLEQEGQLKGNIDNILKASEKSAREAAYNLNKNVATIVVNGLMQYPFIDNAVIKNNFGEVLASGVEIPDIDSFSRSISTYIFDIHKEYTIELPGDERDPLYGYLSITVDKHKAMGNLYERSLIILFSGLLKNLILGAVLASVFYFVLTKPIVKMVQEIKETSPTKKKIPEFAIPTELACNEVGALLITFNKLVLRINDMHLHLEKFQKELQSTNNQLEERVNTRTQELLDSNRLLLESEAKWRTLSENSPNHIMLLDLDYRIQHINYTVQNLTKGQVIGKSSFAFLPADSQQVAIDCFKRVIQSGEKDGFETSYSPTNDETQYFDVQISAIKGDSGKITGLISTSSNITERKKSEQEIRLLSKAVEQSPVSIVIADADAKIEYVNPTFEKISGYSLEEVIGKNPRILKSGKTPRDLYKNLWQAITQGKTWDCEFQNRKKNGEIFWERAHFSPVKNREGIISHYLAIKEDITDRKIKEEKILHQAHFDALTDLPNRFLSLDRLAQLLIEAKRNKNQVAVLFIDLDDFKKVNDSLGHDVGDNLLIKTADRLSSVIRSGDTVGRLGGDEFIVLLSGLDEASDAQSIAENLLAKFKEPFCIDKRELMITASIGISIFPGDGKDASELLRNADSAMYYSKELGRNAYSYFTDAMNQNISRRLSLEEQLHGALERNEFSVFYQPKIDIDTSQIMGAEALLRWSNPVLGKIPPDEFIPIAEKSGLIVSLGEYVLKEALEKTVQWQKKYYPEFQIAVNVSPRQFRDLEFVSFIATAINDSGIRGDHLELEITEGVLMSGHSYIDDALDEINNLHISIAMDDFGTGYSSLSYLRSYPFNVLKIDRSFVNDITVDIADRELTNAAIAMAHGLNLKVVAEGVETEEQLALLQKLNCDYGQGYLFSKPISAEKFTELLKVR